MFLPFAASSLCRNKMFPLLCLFHQTSNSSDSECTPQLFVISSKVCIYNGVFSTLYMRHMLGRSEKLLKVGPLQFSSLWWQVTLYLWRMGCIYKEPKCTLQLPLTYIHVKTKCLACRITWNASSSSCSHTYRHRFLFVVLNKYTYWYLQMHAEDRIQGIQECAHYLAKMVIDQPATLTSIY